MTISRHELAADIEAGAGRVQAARRLLQQAVVETPSLFSTWMKLAAMCGAVGDNEAAFSAVSSALELAPLDFSALLAKARYLERLGAVDAAGLAYGHALVQKPLGSMVPPPLAAIVAHAEQCHASFRASAGERLARATPSGANEEDAGKIVRFCSNIVRTTQVFHQEPSHFHYPGLPEIEFHHRSRSPWLMDVEAASEDINQEFEALLATDAATVAPYVQYPADVPLQQWRALNRSRDWSAIHLLQNGRVIQDNARHCPRTMALLATLPQPRVADASPNAMFSLLAPHTRIPPHSGVANTRLVCHLPIVVPESCGFRVGAETRQWRKGEAFVFDDTIEHEAWNDSDQLRVVMIFDVWAWALSDAERRAVAAIMPQSDVGAADMGL